MQAQASMGCVFALCVGQIVGFPVGQLLALCDFLTEEIGVNFLQAHVLNAQGLHLMLELDERSGFEIPAFAQLRMSPERESDLRDGVVAEQADDGVGHVDAVETEEEGHVAGGHLQQGYLMVDIPAEGGACLGVESQNRLLHRKSTARSASLSETILYMRP
jgi:hypothetical protein